jgi:hypothetical protein
VPLADTTKGIFEVLYKNTDATNNIFWWKFLRWRVRADRISLARWPGVRAEFGW